VEHTDVAIVIGANPAAGHPVFASRLKKRLRKGAKLIVIDPRRTEMVDGPHLKAAHHLALTPGTNVAIVTALAHVIVTEKLYDEEFIRTRCDWDEFQDYAEFVSQPNHSPEAVEILTGVKAEDVRAAARTYATGGNGSIYYGLGVTEHSQGSTTVIGIANLAMMTGNIGRPGVGVNPLRGQNNVQGSCDMGSFPHELPGYRHVKNDDARAIYENLWGVKIDNEPGLRIPNMLDAAVEGTFKGLYCQGEDILQSDPDTHHVAAGLAAMECVIVPERNRELRPCVLPRLVVLGKGRHLHQRRAPDQHGAQGDGPEAGLCRLGSHPDVRERNGRQLELHPPGADHGRDCHDHAVVRRCKL
jgi:formate dehydrogenase major subunit